MSAAVPIVADGSSFRRVVDALADRVTSRRGDQQAYARCPAPDHDDHAPSLSVTWRADGQRGGRTFVFCQRDCPTEAVLAALGLGMPDLFDTPPARPNGRRSGWTPPARPARPKRASQPSPPLSSAGASSRRPDPVAVYHYTDADGVLVFDVLRYERTAAWPHKFAVRSYTLDGCRVMGWRAPAPDRRVLYRLPEVATARAEGRPVLVVEGEKDADAAAAAGAAATCNPFGACDSPGRQDRNWLPQYTEALAGAHVVIVADRDQPGYRHAAFLAAKLAPAAASVRVRQARTGKDLHDHLAAGHGVDDLAPVEPADLPGLAGLGGQTSPSPAEESPEDLPAEDGGRVYAFPTGGPVSGDLDGGPAGPGGGGGAGGSGGGSEPEWVRVEVRDRFEATEHGLFKLKYDIKPGQKKILASELLPVRVRLVGRLVEDLCDGSEPELSHVDLVADRAGEEHRLEGVSRRRWESCSWAAELPWPATFDDTQKGRATLRSAVLATSGPVPLTTMYGVLGWQHIGGRWVYLHAGGGLDATGPVTGLRVHVDEHLAPFALPTPPGTAAEVRAAVLASAAVLDVVPPRIAAPLLGAAYRACLGWCKTTVMPVGGKASGKTGLAALTAQHYAPTARYDRMPGAGAGEAAGTTVGLSELRFRAGDMVLPLDDLAPDRGTERAAARGAEIARSQYNRTGRLKGRREGGFAPDRKPRCLPLLTGEESITVESAESRVVALRVARGDVDTEYALPLLDAGDEPWLRARLTAALVCHYAPAMPMTGWLEATVAELRQRLREEEATDPGLDSRHAESVAELATGWRAMLDMATARGGLTAVEAAELWGRAWAGLVECKAHLMAGSATRTAGDRVRELLLALLTRHEVTVFNRDDGVPQHPGRLGWERAEFGGAEFRPAGTPVGWTNGKKLWLQPGAVFPALNRQAAAEHDPLTYTRVGLGAALADAGVIHSRHRKDSRRQGPSYRPGVPRKVGADRTSVDVWEFDYDWLFPPDPEVDDTPDPPADPPPQPPLSASPADVTGAARPDGGEEAPTAAVAPPAPASAGVCTPDGSEGPQTAAQPPQELRTAGARARRWHITRKAALDRFAGPAVVLDADRAWLARPGQDPAALDLPDDFTVTGMLAWAAGLGLGHIDGRGQYAGAPRAAGQVWLTESARRLLRWPNAVDAPGPAGKVRKSIERSGWTPPKTVGGWLRLARDRQTMFVVVPEWLDNPTRLREDTADPYQLADRIGKYADATGMVLQWSPAVTGVQLAVVTRRHLLARGVQQMPPPARQANAERDYLAQRAPTGEERGQGWAHLYDWNALYLGAASSLPLAWGAYEHLKAPAVDLARPGYWKVKIPAWDHGRLFDPFCVHHRGERDSVWITTPTLKTAVELLGMDLAPAEAWLAVTELDGTPNGKGYGRLLDKWARELSTARSRLAGPGDAVVAKAVKDTYAHGIGRFDAQVNREREHPMWRPDFRHAVIAQGRYAITRRIMTAAEDGRYPLAITTDGIVYAADTSDPAAALPAGFRLGTAVGQVKHEGTAPMSAVAPLLEQGTIPARTVRDEHGNVKSSGLIDTLRAGRKGGDR